MRTDLTPEQIILRGTDREHNIAMLRKRLLLLVGLMILVAPVLVWLASGQEIVLGVTMRSLGPCAIDWHARIGTAVLACPRQDYIRLWPWPIKQPWLEHGDPRLRTVWLR